MKTFMKIAELFEMAIYWLLGMTTIGLIAYSIYGIMVRNHLPLIAY